MSHTPENSAIRITPDLEKQIASASPDQIKAIMARAALEQSLVTPDPYNPAILHPTELSKASPKRFAKTMIIDGQKRLIEGDSPEALLDAESEVYRQALEQQQQGREGQERDPMTGRFVSQETGETPEEKAAREQEVARRAELELQFKRGDISSADYLEQTGAIAEYMVNHGMNPEALATVSDALYQQTWQAATEQFLNSEAGADWPGGSENLALAAKLLEQSPELMNQPSADALAAVWQYMKENNLAVENPEVTQIQQIADATSVADIRTALGRPDGSSGLFNR